jgi:hypothetical protein
MNKHRGAPASGTNTTGRSQAAAVRRLKDAQTASSQERQPAQGVILTDSARQGLIDGSAASATGLSPRHRLGTLAEILKGLGAPPGALVVMDRGIATQENVAWLRAQGYRYLVVSRERRRRFDAAEALDLQTAGGERVAVQRVEDVDAGEVRLYCHSEARARKEEGISTRFAQRFEAALQAMHEGLSRPRTTKRIDKLWERIGRLKEKSHGAGQHYHIEIDADADGEKAQAIRWERRPGSRLRKLPRNDATS